MITRPDKRQVRVVIAQMLQAIPRYDVIGLRLRFALLRYRDKLLRNPQVPRSWQEAGLYANVVWVIGLVPHRVWEGKILHLLLNEHYN